MYGTNRAVLSLGRIQWLICDYCQVDSFITQRSICCHDNAVPSSRSASHGLLVTQLGVVKTCASLIKFLTCPWMCEWTFPYRTSHARFFLPFAQRSKKQYQPRREESLQFRRHLIIQCNTEKARSSVTKVLTRDANNENTSSNKTVLFTSRGVEPSGCWLNGLKTKATCLQRGTSSGGRAILQYKKRTIYLPFVTSFLLVQSLLKL
jgi:hypothetical protein